MTSVSASVAITVSDVSTGDAKTKTYNYAAPFLSDLDTTTALTPTSGSTDFKTAITTMTRGFAAMSRDSYMLTSYVLDFAISD